MVTAQLWSARLASACTRWCNCGESLMTSPQEKAASRMPATNTRARFCERTQPFMSHAACDNREGCASNFLRRYRGEKRCEEASPQAGCAQSKAAAKSMRHLSSISRRTLTRWALASLHLVSDINGQFFRFPLSFASRHGDSCPDLSRRLDCAQTERISRSRSIGPRPRE